MDNFAYESGDSNEYRVPTRRTDENYPSVIITYLPYLFFCIERCSQRCRCLCSVVSCGQRYWSIEGNYQPWRGNYYPTTDYDFSWPMWKRFWSHMGTAQSQASLHICTVSPFALTIYGTIGSFRQKLEICPHWLVPQADLRAGDMAPLIDPAGRFESRRYVPADRSRRQISEPEIWPHWSVPQADLRAGDIAPLIGPTGRFESQRYVPTYRSHRQIWEPEICPQWSVPQADLRAGDMAPLIGPVSRF